MIMKEERLEIRLTKLQKKKIKEESKKAGMTMSAYVISHLSEPAWLDGFFKKIIKNVPSSGISVLRPSGLAPPPKAPSMTGPPKPMVPIVYKNNIKNELLTELKKHMESGIKLASIANNIFETPENLEEKARITAERIRIRSMKHYQRGIKNE
jgi:hypothetical protein